jgi:hypothetical protein
LPAPTAITFDVFPARFTGKTRSASTYNAKNKTLTNIGATLPCRPWAKANFPTMMVGENIADDILQDTRLGAPLG